MDWNTFFTEEPCEDAISWLNEGGFASLDEAWLACPRSDWMLWAVCFRKDGHALTRRQRVEIAVRLVKETPVNAGRTVFDLLEDERIILAIKVAERYVRGEATEEELRSTADVAYAARAMRAAPLAADYAVYAAYAAVRAAAAAVAAQKVQRDIVRGWWPTWTPKKSEE